ncbi:hypothetical protein SAICODRAFT_116664 [Saitoella complicata NRRL Y-17804]|uniref:uncharacterized protein n=1 Tax=Saitoella complicata (strain BCRC 22490 / CBS 7301 / JCM 7358 / NBRC 10748 / NRRL Y-17804) TaxID=698492 RepID=UPI0008679510|nr:uncharacterized protein SAICODRAFT_116664 [Saitoella complicata NRRL Y-17804]ODQ53089.1 hypothetical protein SAICODRAFT_116664 [Saitoella complicata NRRL Y-17804]
MLAIKLPKGYVGLLYLCLNGRVILNSCVCVCECVDQRSLLTYPSMSATAADVKVSVSSNPYALWEGPGFVFVCVCCVPLLLQSPSWEGLCACFCPRWMMYGAKDRLSIAIDG